MARIATIDRKTLETDISLPSISTAPGRRTSPPGLAFSITC